MTPAGTKRRRPTAATACRTTAEVLAAKQPVRRRVIVTLDEEAEVAVEEARRLVDDSQGEAADLARARLAAAQERLAAAQVAFVFRALSRAAYRALVEAHPPTPDQRLAAQARGEVCEFDPDTFPPALLAAVCEEPAMTVEEARELLDGWTTGEAALIWGTAVEVCLTGAVRRS